MKSLPTVDLLTRRIYSRGIDNRRAEEELLSHGWSRLCAHAVERMLLPWLSLERFFSWLDFDNWDTPTTYCTVVRSALISLLLSSPFVLLVLGLFWRSGLSPLWWPLSVLAWPLLGSVVVDTSRASSTQSQSRSVLSLDFKTAEDHKRAVIAFRHAFRLHPPYGVTPGSNAPLDEFDGVIHKILVRSRDITDEIALSRVIAEVLSEAFNERWEAESAIQLARSASAQLRETKQSVRNFCRH